jgi:leucyl aminopeptidase
MEIKLGKSLEKDLVFFVYEQRKSLKFFTEEFKEIKKEAQEDAKNHNFELKNENIHEAVFKKRKVFLFVISKNYSPEELRKAGAQLTQFLKRKKSKETSIELPKEEKEEVQAFIEGLELSSYSFDKYKKEKETNFKINLKLLLPNRFTPTVKRTQMLCEEVKKTRDLVNENSYIVTPQYFEKEAKVFARKEKLKIKILDEKAIQKEKLNLLWAVGKGSEFPPRLIIVEYRGDPKSKEKIALVGKGITFDTGGVNLKPTNFIEEMRCDMAGAATVFGAFKAAVRLKLKKNLVLVLSCAENAISGSAFKSGDIYTSYSGLSVEISNTDAEGRLVLADALSYVQKHYKATTIIDMATLTGACMVALGFDLAGLFGNSKKLNKKLFESGEKTSERIWEFPIYDEHRETLKSSFADLKSIGSRYGGAITAAAFLEKFVDKKVEWAHLDLTFATTKKGSYYLSDFGTGKGVRLLVDFLDTD